MIFLKQMVFYYISAVEIISNRKGLIKSFFAFLAIENLSDVSAMILDSLLSILQPDNRMCMCEPIEISLEIRAKAQSMSLPTLILS